MFIVIKITGGTQTILNINHIVAIYPSYENDKTYKIRLRDDYGFYISEYEYKRIQYLLPGLPNRDISE